MNSDRVKVLVNIYMDKYDEMTARDEGALGTYQAANTCAKNWDIDAEDFGSMFQAAMKDASPILENESQKPLEGIQRLCESGRQEEVREEFRDLLEEDNEDIEARQDKVHKFVDDMNSMLSEEAPGEWQLRQKIRTGIRYLGIIQPNDNFIFKASEAAAFAGYTEVDDAIGFDRKLVLTNYYEMCDDVVDYLSTREDLLKKVSRKLKQKGKQEGDPDLKDIDPKLHLLTYDLIRNSYQRRFYEEKAANRKSKISTVQRRALDRTKKRAELLDEREDVVDEFDEITSLEDKARIPDLTGHKVIHQAYGEGEVTAQDGKYLSVTFAGGTKKKFVLPNAIVDGFLDFNNDRLEKAAGAMKEMSDRKKDVTNRLTAIDVQLQMLE